MTMREELFWMVYGINQGAPAVRDDTYQSAVREAERLARVVPGVKFYVLKSVARAVKVDVETIQIGTDTDDQLPF
jgi:hypothetical protein